MLCLPDRAVQLNLFKRGLINIYPTVNYLEEFLEVEGYGRFEAYSNRDSLKYRSVYGLDDADLI
jgi:hypothetical protein